MRLPEGLELDKSVGTAVAKEHDYSHMVIDISSDEDDEPFSSDYVDTVEPVPMLNVCGGIDFDENFSEEHELHVVQEEIIGEDDIFCEEGDTGKNAVDGESEPHSQELEKDSDSLYICSSQHSTEGSLSQECSQSSAQGKKFID